ncbi:MAG: ankyrin repeat domain-containing protein [Saprospiraceae bacterium]
MIALLIKASLVIIVLLAFYKIILEKESFFAVNRIYLLACLGLTFLLPFLTLPQLINNQGFVSSLLEKTNTQGVLQPSEEVFFQKENTPTTPKSTRINKEISENEIAKKDQVNQISKEEISISPTPIKTNQSTTKGVGFWLLAIYFFGVIILSFNLMAQVINTLLKVFKNDDKVVDDEGTIINMTTKMEPCSFFKYIFINPTEYDYETYEQILAHEKIHVAKWHTLDLLIAEIAVITLWFNPFIWKFRKEIEKNIEYQTDDLLVRGEAEEKEIYQMNLLKIATYTQPLSITTNYNQSLIKNRIIKMNTKKSNPHSFWKYAFIAPTIFGLLLILNKPITLQAMNDNMVENTLEKKINNHESVKTVAKNEIDKHSNIENKAKETTLSTSSNLPSNTAKNINTNATLKVNNKKNCDELEKAAKAKDLKKVREILKNYSPDCLLSKSQQQTDNIALIKQMINQDAEIYIENHSGNITVKGNTINIHSDERHNTYRQTHNSEDIFNPIDHDELDKAINSNNALAAKNILKNLDPKYLVNQNERSRKHLKYIQYILNNGGKLSIDNVTAHIEHDDQFPSPKGQSNFDEKNFQGSNKDCKALINAVRNKDISKVKELLKSTDPNCIDHKPDYETITFEDDLTWTRRYAKTPLIAAARKGYFEIGKLLIDAGARVNHQVKEGETPLIAASASGNFEFVKYLVDQGADINILSNGYGSALNAAAGEGHSDIVKYLISEGANIDAETNGQGSALTQAAGNGELKMVKYLLSKNANIDAATNGQGSALTQAAGNGELEVVKYLLSKNASIDAATNGQGSALTQAAGNGEIEIVKYLLSKNASIDAATNGQGSALTQAAGNGKIEMVKYLLSQGADIDAATNGQGSALTQAAGNGKIEMVKYLLSQGANINAATNGQGSALMKAVQNQDYKIAEFLLEKGANPSLSLPGQNSAMDKARKNNDRKMYDLLKKYDKW